MLQTLGILFPGMPGTTEMVVILLLAVLLFGANKIPKLARSSGEAIGEFKKGRKEMEEELEELRSEGTSGGTDVSNADTVDTTEATAET